MRELNCLGVVEARGAADAEDRAKKVIREKHPKLRWILFKRVEWKRMIILGLWKEMFGLSGTPLHRQENLET
jgi:hypothetical protein